jgi:hypothetical protein
MFIFPNDRFSGRPCRGVFKKSQTALPRNLNTAGGFCKFFPDFAAF